MMPRISIHHAPKGLLDGMVKTEMYIKKSGLDLKLVELLKYRVSQVNGCGYCLDMHHKEAIHLGETEQRLHTVAAWKECPYFTPEEKCALEFADAVTCVQHQQESGELFDNLLEFYSIEQIAILTLVITQINSWNRINKAFGTVPGTYQQEVNSTAQSA